MDDATLDLSGELADDLEANAFIDPRTIPTRFSLLKQMSRSPAHYLHACQQPQDDSLAAQLAGAAPQGTKRSEALRFGTAVHAFLLGESASIGRFTGARRAGKEWTAFQAECAAAGRVEILNEKEWARAEAVAGAIRAKQRAMDLLFDGTLVEQRIDWTFVGKATRSTPDARSIHRIVDLKTCQSAQPELFARHALRLFYHAQAALYLDAAETLTDLRPADAYLIAVEKTAPFPVSIFRFTDRALLYGTKLCRVWIETLNACEAANAWPEYIDDVAELDVADQELELEFEGRRIAL
jgi:hypothetical protein